MMDIKYNFRVVYYFDILLNYGYYKNLNVM